MIVTSDATIVETVISSNGMQLMKWLFALESRLGRCGLRLDAR